MSNRDHQDPKDSGREGQDFEPFMLDMSGHAGPSGASSASGQFSGAEMEFEPFMFDPGHAEGGTLVASPEAPPAAPPPAPEPEPAPVPVTGHTVPTPSYLTSSEPSGQPQPAASPAHTNGSGAHSTSPDMSGVMMGRSRGNTGPLAAERLGSAPTSWSDHSLASIEDFSAVLIAVQAGRKLLQSGPLRAALPAPAGVGAQALAQVPATAAATMDAAPGMDMGHVPQWAAQGEPQATASATASPPEAPPPFIAGADPSSPWAMDRPEWASGASHASPPSSAPVADDDDSGLPPWLTEEDDTPAENAAAGMEPEVMQAEQPPELVSSSFTGTTGVGIEAPQSTLGEPALETDPIVAGALESMNESQPSGIGGDAIEFEGFMFDQGTPAPIANLRAEAGADDLGAFAPFNPPSQAGPAGMVVDQDSEVDGEALPFWLNDSAEVNVTPGEGYIEASEAAAHAGDPLVMGSATPAGEVEEDFADLPPVQPFDFTQIEGQHEDEPLGFNTEELIGMQQGERDPMVVTANLEALADLIGGPLPGGIDPRTGHAAPAGDPSAGAAAAESAAAMHAEGEPEDEAHTFDMQSLDPEDMSWMSTVTTDLAASGLVEPTGMLPQMAAGAQEHDSTGLSGVLGVSPFDINALEEEEESSTSMLDHTPTTGPSTDKLEGKQVAGGPATSPRLDEEYEGDDADTATSIFARPASELDVRPDEIEPQTSRLAEDAAAVMPEAVQQGTPDAETASHVPAQPEPGFFRARVARGQWSNNVPLVVPQDSSADAPDGETLHSPWDGGHTGMRAEPQAPAQAQAEPQVPLQAPVEAQAPVQEHKFEMPRPGDPTVSGPLPVLTGYEDLVELMEKNPQDVGSYMAMATAYVNSGEFESALRVYRRLIKRPGVSATMLNMVDEELEELKGSAGEMPRYHQVRGDVFLKLGRHREAIDEYNKVV